ncbi:MAG: TIGR04086 family membrane protein [Cellulosilyticaceae bacterium]
MKKHKGKKSNIDMPAAIATMLKANAMAYVVTAIFVILGSIVLTYTNLGASFEKWIILIGIILSAFLAGFDTAKIEPRNGYKWGGIGGIVYLGLFIILAAVLGGVSSLDLGYLMTIAILVLVSSGIAGMISVNTQK